MRGALIARQHLAAHLTLDFRKLISDLVVALADGGVEGWVESRELGFQALDRLAHRATGLVNDTAQAMRNQRGGNPLAQDVFAVERIAQAKIVTIQELAAVPI